MKPLFFSPPEETCSLIHWYKNHLCKSCPQRMDTRWLQRTVSAVHGNGNTVMNLQWLAQDFQSGISLIFTLLLILLPQINKSCFCWVACRPHTHTHTDVTGFILTCVCGGVTCTYMYPSCTFTVANGALIQPEETKLRHKSTCCYCCHLQNHKLHQETRFSLFTFFPFL